MQRNSRKKSLRKDEANLVCGFNSIALQKPFQKGNRGGFRVLREGGGLGSFQG